MAEFTERPGPDTRAQNENMNAKKELLDHIGGREVKYVRVIREHSYDNKETIEGALDSAI
jgi:hypothetical protein